MSRAVRRDGDAVGVVEVVVAEVVAVAVGTATGVTGPDFRIRALVPAPLANDALLRNWNPALLRCAFRRSAGMSATVIPVVNATCFFRRLALE